MSMYYHEFTIGFNLWEVVLPFGLVIMIAPAIMRYRISSRKGYHVVEVYSYKLLVLMAAILTMIFGALFVSESWVGVLQALDNCLTTNDSGAWSLILLPITILAICAMAFGLFYGAGIIFSWTVLGKLTEDVKNPEKMEARHQRNLARARAYAAKRQRRLKENHPSH